MTAPGRPLAGAAPAGPAAAEFLFTEEDFRHIAALLHADAGILLPEAKAMLVYSRLAKRLRALGLESFRDYCALVMQADGVDERQRMLAALTTNVTRFFREPHHFEHLKTKLLPPLMARARTGGRVRIWSAGCSNGQEPYSIALTLLSAVPDAAALDVKVLATDIDPNMVAEGREGVYGETVTAPIPKAMRDRWFTPVQADGVNALAAGPELRRIVSFRELNLIGDWPMKGRFDAIFCRNVAIYFADHTQARIWSRFVPLLQPGGALYIGHSERVTGEAYAHLRVDGVTTYRPLPGERS